MSDAPDPAGEGGIPVPAERLDPETLHAVIEEFVTREGTDYGERVFDLEEKVAHVRGQLRRGEARVVYDPRSETVTIVAVP